MDSKGRTSFRVFQKRGRLLFRQRIPEFHFADLGDLAHLRAYAFFFVRRRPARQQKRALCLGEFLRGLQPLLFQKQHVPQQAYLVDVFRQLLPLILQLPLHFVQACEAAFVPVNEQRRGAAGFRELRLLSPRLTAARLQRASDPPPAIPPGRKPSSGRRTPFPGPPGPRSR